MSISQLTIRATTPIDDAKLSRLAVLDSGPRLRGQGLIAERDGEAVAAIALTSGSVVADPFNPTADIVRALRERRYRLLRQGGDTGQVSSLLRRLAPQGAA
jgi:hypothetical protein